jgi:hypothetical protein
MTNNHNNGEGMAALSPAQIDAITRWAQEINMYLEDLYQESDETMLRQILSQEKDLGKLASSMKRIFLEEFEVEWVCALPCHNIPFPLIGLLQHYCNSNPAEKALINFVLRRLANVTIPSLVDRAARDLP